MSLGLSKAMSAALLIKRCCVPVIFFVPPFLLEKSLAILAFFVIF
jgi:hypothetical protein